MNFNSPYRATSIIEFWRRWHMTLSRFLRNYLYIPLGGNRRGRARQISNLMATMLLGGLWHGAGWTFVAWGGLHGIYLLFNNMWAGRLAAFAFPGKRFTSNPLLSGGLTFLAVTVAWVFFRAETFGAAVTIVGSMSGMNGFDWQSHSVNAFPSPMKTGIWIGALGFIVWFLPDTHQIMSRYRYSLDNILYRTSKQQFKKIRWQATPLWAMITGVITAISIIYIARTSEFLYFQF
jgi:hypothetical protein